MRLSDPRPGLSRGPSWLLADLRVACGTLHRGSSERQHSHREVPWRGDSARTTQDPSPPRNHASSLPAQTLGGKLCGPSRAWGILGTSSPCARPGPSWTAPLTDCIVGWEADSPMPPRGSTMPCRHVQPSQPCRGQVRGHCRHSEVGGCLRHLGRPRKAFQGWGILDILVGPRRCQQLHARVSFVQAQRTHASPLLEG